MHGHILGDELAVERISTHDALAICTAMPSCGGFSYAHGDTFGYGHIAIDNPHLGHVVHFYNSNQTGTLNFAGQPKYHEGWMSYAKWNF